MCDRLLAWLMRHAMGPYERRVANYKRQLFAGLGPHETIAEIGAGTGPNRVWLPSTAKWIPLDPNPFMPAALRAAAEHLPLADASVDSVISTLVLCSVENQQQALAEIRRVLKPGGRFYYLEHVAAPLGTRRRALQHALRPACHYCAGGCNPLRDTGRAIAEAGFEDLWQTEFTLGFPHLTGVSLKAALS